jgi:hypothetical protein
MCPSLKSQTLNINPVYHVDVLTSLKYLSPNKCYILINVNYTIGAVTLKKFDPECMNTY